MEMNMSEETKLVQREDFPAGDRKIRILDAKESTSKSGNEMIEWTVEDIETGKQDIIYTVAVQKKRWALKNLLDACGVIVKDGEIYVFELDKLIDRVVIATNKPFEQEFINRKGETKTNLKNKFTNFEKYIPKEGEEEIPF
jgi:hypothetical protein